MAAGSLYELRFVQYGDGGTVMNVFHLEDVTGLGTAEDLVDKWNSVIVPFWAVAQVNTHQYLTNFAQEIYPLPLDAAFATPATAVATGGSGSPPPSYCAIVFQLRTGFANRRKRGRFFMGGLWGFQHNGSVVNPAAYVLLQNFINNMSGALLGASPSTGYRLGVLSRATAGHTYPLNPAGFTPVTAISYTTVLGVQRRRKKGVGM